MSAPVPVDPGLLARLRAAHAAIVWTDAVSPPPRSGRRARNACLHDEVARIETWESAAGSGILATSGPVGALVLLIEIDQRGPPRRLGSFGAEADPGFPDGAIGAVWGQESLAATVAPRLRDLVDLARYALP